MKKPSRFVSVLAAISLFPLLALASAAPPSPGLLPARASFPLQVAAPPAAAASSRLAFTVSMEPPAGQTYGVVFRCEGLRGQVQEFKMPVWSPGYYGIMDFAGNVGRFRAADGEGRDLPWEREGNIWKVRTGDAPVVVVSYNVRATSTFVANPYLGEDRGYIVGTGVFMHVGGLVQHPVTVEIKLPPGWTDLATGLDPVSPDTPHILAAPDFDVLYDSPILMGILESLPPFEIDGVPHRFIGHRLGTNFDHGAFIAALKSVVAQGIAVVGEIPYKHYTFIGIGSGQGGIEHLNSTTVPFTGSPVLNTKNGLVRQMNFLGHEFFHAYNVKRIRPIALGPFDYDKANLTNMLWVSEGFTSYYANLMVARAGLITLEELLDGYRRDIASYENGTGRLFQSATRSSWETWTQGPFGGRGRGGVVKSISYYSKGSVLGLLLDFKIRHETKNAKSLDTVMRTLYRRFYKELGRGWTDEEFQEVCEGTAGASLEEIFRYASTTDDVDYDKYLGYAGLALEKPEELSEGDLGAVVEDIDGRTLIAALESDSSAVRAGLAAGDEIKAADGAKVDAASLAAAVSAKKPGERIKLTIGRDGKDLEVDTVLKTKLLKSFRIRTVPKPDALQRAILEDWIRPR